MPRRSTPAVPALEDALLRYDVPTALRGVVGEPNEYRVPSAESRIAPAAAGAIRAAIRLAGGREVCFVAIVDDDGMVQTARVVARGDVRSVLALPGVAKRGQMLVHNHPSGDLEPSGADLDVAARLHDGGI